jgi:hypothetical protein
VSYDSEADDATSAHSGPNAQDQREEGKKKEENETALEEIYEEANEDEKRLHVQGQKRVKDEIKSKR